MFPTQLNETKNLLILTSESLGEESWTWKSVITKWYSYEVGDRDSTVDKVL